MTTKHNTFSRRSLLRSGAAVAGTLAASKLMGVPLIGEARAATADDVEAGKRHVLIVNLMGGFNALFPSAGSFLGRGDFGVTSANMVKQIAPNYSVDATTFGTLSPFLLDHSAAIGVRHGLSSHAGAEAALMSNGTRSYPLRLAQAMGGDAAIKAAILGTAVSEIEGPKPQEGDVSWQQIADMATTIAALGGDNDPSVPDRDVAAAALEASQNMSRAELFRNAKMLTSVAEGGAAATATLKKPAKQFNVSELRTAYGVTGTDVDEMPSRFMAAELMFLAGANVAMIQDEFNWDSHGDTTGTRVRNMMNATIMPGLKAFLSRMVDSTSTDFQAADRNVSVLVIGDWSRSLPGSDEQPNLTSWVVGRTVKAGSTGTVAANVSLSASSGNVIDQYNLLAKLMRVGQPFGMSTINDALVLP